MALAPQVAELPDFWGISLVVAVAAFVLVVISVVGDWYYVPGILGAFAATIFWWIATGLDNWAENGGVLSTPYAWVWIDILASLLIGCLLGLLLAKLAGLFTPAADRELERSSRGRGYTGEMKLPVRGPRDLFGVLERGADQLEALLGVVPRVVALLDEAERLVARIGPILDRVEAVATAAAVEVAQVDGVVDEARLVVDRTSGVVGQAETLVSRLTPLLDSMEPSLVTLQPTLERLAETTHPAEVDALVSMVDHLPELARRLEADVLPVMGALGSVAPDLHDLLSVSRELNEIIGKVPGFGRIKRRVEEEQEEQEEDDDSASR